MHAQLIKKTVKNGLFLCVLGITSQTYAINKTDIVGTWSCTSSDKATGMVMQSTDTYNRNGTSSANGMFTLNMPNMSQTITVNMVTQGTWSLNGNSIQGKLVSASANSPQFPQLANLFKQQLQQNMSASSKILSLTKNHMKLLVSSQNLTVNCRK